ncbi:flagellar hook-length control protein FliK, partial [Methylorubrum populi]|nr:flagellar hook-length control protein FliK [Methylorubrum rhodesianum]MBY0143054.1 flagellar hook-length control protein FliK [Methylorubrum populi]
MVSRTDLAEVFFRQTLRPASPAGRGSEGAARFSLEAAERKPAAPTRPALRRDEAASARSDADGAEKWGAARTAAARAEAAEARISKAGNAKADATKTDGAGAEGWRSGVSAESRARLASARGTSRPESHAAGGSGADSARAPGRDVDSPAQRPERPAEGEAVQAAAQEAAAEGAAAEEAGALALSEDEPRDQDETDHAAAVDPTALLSPPPAATTAPTAPAAGGSGESGPVAGGPGETAATGHAAKADPAARPTSAAPDTAGFEAALD